MRLLRTSGIRLQTTKISSLVGTLRKYNDLGKYVCEWDGMDCVRDNEIYIEKCKPLCDIFNNREVFTKLVSELNYNDKKQLIFRTFVQDDWESAYTPFAYLCHTIRNLPPPFYDSPLLTFDHISIIVNSLKYENYRGDYVNTKIDFLNFGVKNPLYCPEPHEKYISLMQILPQDQAKAILDEHNLKYKYVIEAY